MTRDKGFTLIEVLVALVIVALVGLSTQTLLSQLAEQRFNIQQRTIGDALVWNSAVQAFVMSAQENPPQDLYQRKRLNSQDQSWDLSYKIEATLLGDLERVEVMVKDKSGEQIARQLVFFK
ncbi:hypothetical protein XMG59_002235 [Marinobacterium sp. xm-g-59]|uniref:prepilin-type N-terminal cleavage/methylation domain-containing protein n=1 Tax=Marinobacterium sp. xm-g-59 TaxID=2497748 RepID=UPI0015686D35|nr:prepilin-type N-terminal cleavage/methylation domain-containing protein [Marinobacterium sp. xm-g-59]NRP96117.1 hypothetical protein [Marinobacterium sp. xm-g-59]